VSLYLAVLSCNFISNNVTFFQLVFFLLEVETGIPTWSSLIEDVSWLFRVIEYMRYSQQQTIQYNTQEYSSSNL